MRQLLPGIHVKLLKILLPAGVAALIVIFFLLGTFDPLQHTLNDAQFRWKADRKAGGDIVIISIDPESESEMGTAFERWKRAWTGEAITNLTDAGAEIIALDFRYAARPGEEEDDNALATAIADAENVVLAAMIEGGKQLRSDPQIREGSLGDSFLNVSEDEDGVMRRIRFLKVTEDELPFADDPVPMLYFDVGIVAAYKYMGIEDVSVEGDKLVLTEKDEDGNEIGKYRLTLGNHPINYVGPAGSFKRIPFWKIYKNEFDPEEVAGKICLMGDTRLRGGDFFITPHSEYYRPTPESEPILKNMPGIEVHANGIQTILENRTIRESTNAEAIVFILLFGIGIGLLVFFLQRGGLVLPAIVATLLQVVIIYMSYKLFASYEYQMASVSCIVVVALQFTAGMCYRWLAARKRMRQIQEMFGRYVSANVVKKMISGELSVNLEGHMKDITVCFLDIRNFTKTSENMTPEQIGHFLNSFFSKMINVIFSADGTLDKLMGDCIMWFFNDPEEQADHFERAADVSLKMLRELKQFKENSDLPGVEHMDIGIGINTGKATVGNLGAPEFHDYTAVGDTVNLGSRLEGLNKEYGTNIIVGELTYEKIRGKFFCRELDLVRVKGKELPVRIYELLAPKDEASEEQKQLASEFERHLESYRKKDFEKACASFESLAGRFENDKACAIYAERCRVLAQNPPDESWSGVFTFTTK